MKEETKKARSVKEVKAILAERLNYHESASRSFLSEAVDVRKEGNIEKADRYRKWAREQGDAKAELALLIHDLGWDYTYDWEDDGSRTYRIK